MKRTLAPAALALLVAGACSSPDAAVAPPGPEASLARASDRSFTVEVLLTDANRQEQPLMGGLVAMYHRSRNNEWLNLASQQPAGVTILGPGRIQYHPGTGETRAEGILIALLPIGELRVNLADLVPRQGSPFEIGPGGGCIAFRGRLYGDQHPRDGTPITIQLDFPLPQN